MTEYELVDAAASQISAAQGWIAIFLTIFSGYLVIAYLVGSELSRPHALFISGSFAAFAAICIRATTGSAYRLVQFSREIEAINPDRDFGAGDPQVYVLVTTMWLAVLMALIFMWGIRRKSIK